MEVYVSDDELLWVVAAFEPTTVREISDPLPIGYQATLYRVTRLHDAGALVREADSDPYLWYLSIDGEERVAATDLPPVTESNAEEYFADVTTPGDITPRTVLETLARLEGDWQSTPDIDAELPVSRATVRRRLHTLVDEGLVTVEGDRPYRWRLTEDGERQLTGNQ